MIRLTKEAASRIALLPLVDWHISKVSFTDIFSSRADEFVVGVLFEDVAGPARNAADREYWRVKIKRDSHHVVSRG